MTKLELQTKELLESIGLGYMLNQPIEEKRKVEKFGLNISCYIRDTIKDYSLLDYEHCQEIATKIDNVIKDYDFLALFDGTTFDRGFIPTKKKG